MKEHFLERIGGVVFTKTARAALKIILDYLKSKGIIENKNSEVLVPKWMCIKVLQLMHTVCFPVLTPTENTKGVLVYHQYGYPQNMDEIMEVAREKNWFVIEDCANVYESYYRGRRLGTFGLASIFSFSKMFPSLRFGALISQNKQLLDFAKNSGMMYAGDLSNLNNMVERRKVNYRFLLDYFQDYDFFNGLEREIVPYVVPLITDERRLKKIKDALLVSGIWTDIYHFDVNRNLLNPKFVKCVWIPVHLDNMSQVCKIIKCGSGKKISNSKI